MKFGRLTDLLNNVRKLDADLIFVKVVNNEYIQEFVIFLNTVDQIFEGGVGADGKLLGVYSNRGYINEFRGRTQTAGSPRTRIASGEKALGEHWNLVASGKMLDSFDVTIDGGGFVINADTMKTDSAGNTTDYDEKYNILGLNDESKTKLAQEMLPLVREEVRKILLS